MKYYFKFYLLTILITIVSCKKDKIEQSNTSKNKTVSNKTVSNKTGLNDTVFNETPLNDSIEETGTLIKIIAFKVNHQPKDDDIQNIDFSKEKPRCNFTLKGKIPLKYCFYLENDSVAKIQQFKNDKFQFQENLNYQPWF